MATSLRSRLAKGAFTPARRKPWPKGDTSVDALRQAYGPEFAAGYRGNMRLDTLLDRTGAKSLTEYLRLSKRTQNQWPASVRALAGAWPDFPTVREIRKLQTADLPRQRL